MQTDKFFTNRISVALLAVFCCLLWGSAFPGVKMGYRLFDIPLDNTWLKIMFAGYRFFLAGLLILGYAVLTGQKLSFPVSCLKHFFFIGLIGTALSYFFFYLGLSRTTGVKGSVINSTMIFFTVIIAHFAVHDDRINRQKAIGLILGFTGVIAANFSFELLKPDFNLTGDGFLIISQFMGAVSTVYIKKVSGIIPVIVLTGGQMLIGSLLLIIPASTRVGLFSLHFTPAGLALYLYLALLSAVAFSLWNTIIKYNSVGRVSFYQFLIPVFGAVLSPVFLSGEKVTPAMVIALVLVSVGIFGVNISPKKGPAAPKANDG